jgi:hypothetical protein
MKIFINLTSRVINKLHIVEIIKRPNKYEIHMSNSSIEGFLIFAGGELNTKHNIIEICNKKDKQDYETLTDFMKHTFEPHLRPPTSQKLNF